MYHVLILHFDDAYFHQEKLRRKADIEIDLRFLKGTKFMCTSDILRFMDRMIPDIRSWICFTGKGKYHYISFIFLKRIKQPFALVIVDNHLDMKYSYKDFIKCDSWVYRAGMLENIKEIFYINSLKIDRIPETRYPVYLSIDKDILAERYLITGWTQGKSSPYQIFNFISEISSMNRIISMDICGEPELDDIKEIKKSEAINLTILKCLKLETLKKSA